jgi:hypothetical protein
MKPDEEMSGLWAVWLMAAITSCAADKPMSSLLNNLGFVATSNSLRRVRRIIHERAFFSHNCSRAP